MKSRSLLWGGVGVVGAAGAVGGAWMLSLPAAREFTEPPPIGVSERQALLAALKPAMPPRPVIASVCINDAVIFMVSPELPFGGVGASGMGRYTGWYGFETFSHMKPVMKRSFRFDAPLRYPPYDDFKAKVMRLVR